MARGTYFIVDEATEDRYDEVSSLDDAVRIARGLVRVGRPISIEHGGRVIHQLVAAADGTVNEVPIGTPPVSDRLRTSA